MSNMPINDENARQLREWAASVPDQARRALEENGPKLTAAFESFAKAIGRRP